jgi:hypothetical protein
MNPLAPVVVFRPRSKAEPHVGTVLSVDVATGKIRVLCKGVVYIIRKQHIELVQH